jgi:hypothetical protein
MNTFFHGTSSENLPLIQRFGLKGGMNLTEDRNVNKEVVFLTTNYESAAGYAGRSKAQRGGERIVLVIKTNSPKPWKNKRNCSIFISNKVRAEEIFEIHHL